MLDAYSCMGASTMRSADSIIAEAPRTELNTATCSIAAFSNQHHCNHTCHGSSACNVGTEIFFLAFGSLHHIHTCAAFPSTL